MNPFGDSLEQRVAALERRSLGGGVYGAPGVSTAFGAATTVLRAHFPAELTSSYSTSTGYSWKRLMLDRSASSPAFAAATNPDAGSYAFTPDDNQTLVSGDKGYLFADATAGGWVFLPESAGGGGSVSSDLNEMTGSTNFFIVGDSFWYDVGTASATAAVDDLSLPSAGTYLLTMQVSGGGALSAGGPELIYARLYNETDAVAVPGTTIVVTDVNGITAFRGTSSSGSVAVPLVTTGAKTIRLEARRSNFNTSTWVAHPSFYNNSLSSSSPGGTSIGYIKLS